MTTDHMYKLEVIVMKKRATRVLALALTVIMATALLGACASSGPQSPAGNQGNSSPVQPAKEVVIKYPSFQIGVNSYAPVMEEALKRFNEANAGKYKVEIEEIPGDQAYVDKMKALLSVDQLPDIVFTGGYNLLDLALAKDAVVDLTPYMNEDSNWKDNFSDAALDFNSRDGKIYAVPAQTDLIGYFYNKELFTQAGISPAKTWDEFFSNCEKLSAAGITPLSMDTADSGWVTSLWLMALVGTNGSSGEDFANAMSPTDYNVPEFIDAVTKIQDMYLNYTTSDAVGGAYEAAANNFLTGKTAMIANGPWMISDFEDTTKADAGFAGKVGSAIFPGGGVFDSVPIGYFVCAKDADRQKAAVEFVKYMTSEEVGYLGLDLVGQIPATMKVKVDDNIKSKYPLLADLLDAAKSAEFRFNHNQALWYPNTIDEISAIYPSLAMGQMTPEDFAKKLSDAAKKNLE